ncbi:zinc-dependent alcohol dehydrogenase [Nocardioides sp. T2.26MG-1]|uniref:zinc-dependent alcohol dehydrogenase n=1 Tax=Nocardioides sp. T2.26MG-1 TaxID=3041166 RepID=UPI002477498F|nr:zinc-binding alcohol dehydrogenase [Nocardioides sp. T2.26MG-1]CAI9403525.1 L-threonine 3-dehydrogenase [Nocardioides sp. T2.26MG-1]
MPQVVSFNAPRDVSLVECDVAPLTRDGVRVRTWYSGISAGTELTAYRGTNPYLNGTWDAEARLFRAGSPTFAYPVAGWGYSEMGEVVEVGTDVTSVSPGDLVHGIWGHRSEAVIPAAAVADRTLSRAADPRTGTFARVGAIALNAVLASDARLGDRVAVFGQGVIGLLATRLLTLAGAEVTAVDAYNERLAVARELGAAHVVRADHPDGAGAAVRDLTGGAGMDAAIELSGSDRALHEATRCVVVDGTVVASGFYQGGATHLRLGEEFHHNRVRIVASQISGTPLALGPRWHQPRLVRVFMDQVAAGRVDVARLVTDVVDAADVARAFERLDAGDPGTLQVLLRFDAAPIA